MSHMGSVPAYNLAFTAAANPGDIPGSAASPRQLTANLGSDISSIEIANNLGAPVNLYTGPDASLQLLCIIPGFASTAVVQQRQPVVIPQGSRLSIRAAGTSAITAGSLIINAWK